MVVVIEIVVIYSNYVVVIIKIIVFYSNSAVVVIEILIFWSTGGAGQVVPDGLDR
jgi:hypothetical protein